MNSELENIKTQLLERKQALLTRLARIKDDMGKQYSRDWSEQAQERENDEVLEAIGVESSSELNMINQALQRIESGQYTICSECGDTIAWGRLKAIPQTNLCTQCAEKQC
ncbi:MAG: TraR/DksA family transcriptional regulator [Gammaproteobacteria bacterium]|nr:TraR/DksA family transcriptional regulator [Gammaproteobacteria bacterium]